MRIPKFIRIAQAALTERDADGDSMITGPADFVSALKPRYGVVVASWDESAQLGIASRLGVVLRQTSMGAVINWMPANLQYRPSSSGRRFWVQAKPFFAFAPDVAERYLLAPTFAEHFLELESRSDIDQGVFSSSPSGMVRNVTKSRSRRTQRIRAGFSKGFSRSTDSTT